MFALVGCAFDAGSVSAEKAAPCDVAEDEVHCSFSTVVFHAGLAAREVHFALPVGDPPEAGWPVAMVFQGSLYPGVWDGDADEPFGGLHEAEVVAALLDGGWAVVAPEAQWDGATWWQTNVSPWAWAWETSADHRLMVALFSAIEAGELGPLDADRMVATGISSGGYMTSRMAVSYPGRFSALAIASASYATCSGPLCVVPNLPEDHPPTLFLHGEADAIVPIGTMETYAEALDEGGVETRVVTEPGAGHEWLEVGPEEVTGWFGER